MKKKDRPPVDRVALLEWKPSMTRESWISAIDLFMYRQWRVTPETRHFSIKMSAEDYVRIIIGEVGKESFHESLYDLYEIASTEDNLIGLLTGEIGLIFPFYGTDDKPLVTLFGDYKVIMARESDVTRTGDRFTKFKAGLPAWTIVGKTMRFRDGERTYHILGDNMDTIGTRVIRARDMADSKIYHWSIPLDAINLLEEVK